MNDRVECAKRIYNATLHDGLALVERMRQDPGWEQARTLPKAKKGQPNLRAEAFKALRVKHGFSDFDLQRIATQHKNAAGFTGRIGSNETQAVGTRVYQALNPYVLGKRGKPRFKGLKRPLHSLDGKNHAGMLRWDLESSTLRMEKDWSIPVQLPDLKKDEWLAAALQHPTKFCRVLWKNEHEQRRWYVQLVQDGQTPIKASVLHRLAPEHSVGGLDLGPSTVAWITDQAVGVNLLAPEVNRPERVIRRLQRTIDRQRRANNPSNYHPDGQAKKRNAKGVQPWKTSRRQKKNEATLAGLLRYEADVRTQSHGRLINALLSQARVWKDDGVSAKALQKQYGKSVGKRAPGLFMDALTRKAERAGGRRIVIDVQRLKTSQYDHSTNTYAKKPLSQRWHVFGDGRGKVQRDVYSAFLAREVDGNTHQPSGLEKAWLGVASVLQGAGWYVTTNCEEGAVLPPGRTSSTGGAVRPNVLGKPV